MKLKRKLDTYVLEMCKVKFDWERWVNEMKFRSDRQKQSKVFSFQFFFVFISVLFCLTQHNALVVITSSLLGMREVLSWQQHKNV